MLFIQEIDFYDPEELFCLFADIPWSVFLDSASEDNQYSFIGIDPFLKVHSKNNSLFINEIISLDNPFFQLKKLLKQYPLEIDRDLCPFQGGAIGYFGYDLYRYLEKISEPLVGSHQFPDMCIGFYDLVLGFNLTLKKAWIFSSGYPEKNYVQRKKHAKSRIDFLIKKVQSEHKKTIKLEVFKGKKDRIRSNFTKKTYQDAVEKAIQYILEGDIFQVNLSQQFSAKIREKDSFFALYKKLREINPAPFASYLNFSPTYVLSASPERF